MAIRISHCFVTVHDQEEALTFYRDLVGLEVCDDVAIGSMRWLTVAAPGQPGGVQISLETPDGRAGEVDALSRVVSAGSLTAVIVETDDCDVIFERLRHAGCAVIQTPKDQPYRVRDCAVRDPSGNMVRLSQPLAG